MTRDAVCVANTGILLLVVGTKGKVHPEQEEQQKRERKRGSPRAAAIQETRVRRTAAKVQTVVEPRAIHAVGKITRKASATARSTRMDIG